MKTSEFIKEERAKEGAPYVRRILQICENKTVLIKAGIEHREVLEKAGFTYVRNASEIRKLTSYTRVAVSPCACGNLFSVSTECRCSEKLIAIYESRMQNLQAKVDITIRIDGNLSPSLKDLTPSFIDVLVQDYEIDSELTQLLSSIKKRFGFSSEKVLVLASELASLDGQSKLSKTYLLEAVSFLR